MSIAASIKHSLCCCATSECVFFGFLYFFYVFHIIDLDSSIQYDPSNPTDSDSRNNDDFGMNMAQIPTLHDNPGNPTEFEATASITDIRCINCGKDVSQRTRRRLIMNSSVASVVRQWIAPRLVNGESVVCQSCWMVALRESHLRESPTSDGRHRQLCISCRCSLHHTRYHVLNEDTQRGRDVNIIVANWIQPAQLIGGEPICHVCWSRANQRASRGVNPVEEHPAQLPDQYEATIELPHLSRAGESQSNCFVHSCTNADRIAVPPWLRIKLFREHAFYVRPTCRICRTHLQSNEWDLILEDNYLHLFSARHIEDFASFVRIESYEDWNNLETVSDDLFFNSVGLNKNQFNELKMLLQSLHTKKYASIALVAFLCRLRTGDSYERISNVLKISVTTCKRYVAWARDSLQSDFVPSNLGISHISREQIQAKNLLIPRELFARNNNSPIVIVDGTYVYVQKSSNYLYQKNTYSLHKYRNLFKPLLIVCCDGYIIDILGPYPATTSDAKIMLHEFGNNQQPLRQYFQPGDVFILDRGFRDCIPLLQECNYSPHMPASLQHGETQLSTIAANQSRKVTLCRWVVETVNGVMKKCFKLFRHEFFNKSMKHAMDDFRIAGALVNKFHQRYKDREDAGHILQNIRLQEQRINSLGDYVLENNLNRRRAVFTSISGSNVSFPQLTISQLILITCGTYQLKQARSYYAESVRVNGSYTVEICNGSNLLEQFRLANNNQLIRGKIKSRHISQKTYFSYIMHDTNAINDYYCSCLVGRRTVGCCAHVCTIIWYLGWARYQDVAHPAQHLDNTLIVFEEEE